MFRLPRLALFLFFVASGAPLARADNVTATRAWTNCQGGEGIWSELRISGCNEVVNSGKAAGGDLAKAYYYRGNALLAHGEYRKAIEDYDRALEIDAADPNALHERCWARAVLGAKLEDALSDCNESLRIRPNDGEALGGRGFVYLRLGFYRTAILDYDAALDRLPENADFLFARGTAKVRAGDVEGGNADIAAARSLDSKVEATFERYDGARDGGFWTATIEYWRAVMKWIY